MSTDNVTPLRSDMDARDVAMTRLREIATSVPTRLTVDVDFSAEAGRDLIAETRRMLSQDVIQREDVEIIMPGLSRALDEE